MSELLNSLNRRLDMFVNNLDEKAKVINEQRKKENSIEQKVIGDVRYKTNQPSFASDVVYFNNKLIVGINPDFSRINLTVNDIVPCYDLDGTTCSDNFLDNEEFIQEIRKLVAYFKNVRVFKLSSENDSLYLTVSTNKEQTILKTFVWDLVRSGNGNDVVYRGEHNRNTIKNNGTVDWTIIRNEEMNYGYFPNKPILNTVFVFVGNGEICISKVNDTNKNRAVLKEKISSHQIVGDTKVHYSEQGDLILFKIEVLGEGERGYIYNKVSGSIYRADGILSSLVLYDNMMLFSNGYLIINSDEFKEFNISIDYHYQNFIKSPNGEDALFVFFNLKDQSYVLYPYNIVSQEISQYILANGYTIISDGTLVLSVHQKSVSETHSFQMIQTPYLSQEVFLEREQNREGDDVFAKVNNATIVSFLSGVFALINVSRLKDGSKAKFDNINKMINEIKHKNNWVNNYQEFKEIVEGISTVNSISLNILDEVEKSDIKAKSDELLVEKLEKDADSFVLLQNPNSVDTINEISLIVSQTNAKINEIDSLSSSVDNKTLLERISAKKDALFEHKESATQALIKVVANKESFDQFFNSINEVKEQFNVASTLKEITEIKESIDQISNSVSTISEEISDVDIDDLADFESIQSSLNIVYSEINSFQSDVEAKYNTIYISENGVRFKTSVDLLNQLINNELSRVSTLDELESVTLKINNRIDTLDNQFSDFEAYANQFSEMRDTLSKTVSDKREIIINQRNKEISGLERSFNLNVRSVKGRIDRLESVSQLNEFFASDSLVKRSIDVANKIREAGDGVKADQLISELVKLKDSSYRDIKDKQDLYVDGGNFLKLGRYKFPVNREKFSVNIIHKEDGLYANVSSTDYEKKLDGEVNDYQDIFDMVVYSENKDISRSEFLAYSLMKKYNFNADNIIALGDNLISEIRELIMSDVEAGYSVGVHDADAEKIVLGLVPFIKDGVMELGAEKGQVIRYLEFVLDRVNFDESVHNKLVAANKIFEFSGSLEPMANITRNQLPDLVGYELAISKFISQSDIKLTNEIFGYGKKVFDSYKGLLDDESIAFNLDLLMGVVEIAKQQIDFGIDVSVDDLYLGCLAYLFSEKRNYSPFKLDIVDTKENLLIEGIRAHNSNIKDGTLQINMFKFFELCKEIDEVTRVRFNELRELKRKAISQIEADLNIDTFEAKPISAFIRNKLISESYLDIFGNNLSKQIGASGVSVDQMGLLMLISPPGYGKTTLVEYIASKMGMAFIKINCPSIGHNVTSLDPSEATDLTSRKEIEKINNAFELGNNTILYLDDIQHTNPELLQKFISLCDATRTVDGVIDGKQKTFNLKGKKFAVIMSGNPYTESGDVFKVPDMLANRADVYNLGDMLSDQVDLFNLSYIENSLTSNEVLSPLAFRDLSDVYEIVNFILGRVPNLSDVKHKYESAELNTIVDMIRNVMKIQKVVAEVNQEYILSSTISEDNRVEPAFKLQGSYRNMNKIVSKLFVGITDGELNDLIIDHYNSESQTLTNQAEENILKFREITGRLSDIDSDRLNEIRKNFTDSRKNKNEELLMIVEAIKNINKL